MKDEQSNGDEDAILSDEDMTLDEMTAAAILNGIKRQKSAPQDGNPLEELKRATEDF